MSAPASPTDVSTFEGLRHSLYRRLLESVEHSATNKRFFPCSTGAAVLKSVDLRQIFDFVVAAAPGIQLTGDQFADRVQARKLHTFLAVLIYSQSTIRAVLSFATCLVVPDQWPRQLGVLPISREDARTVLNDDVAADNFCKNQDEFCAVIIQQNQEVVCDGQRLLPYLSEEHLGTGAFGRVYKIEVAPYHFVSRDGLLNQEKYPMARKDYILDEGVAHKRERDFMREILRNPKKHDNILKNLGSLQTGSTYSVFMELADHDLWDYMTVHHPDGPTTLKQKADLLYCATELAAALAHLHDDILTETFEKLSCFHLDLKPRNILVVTEEDQNTHQFVQRWKLSDFNMSKAKAKHHAPYLQRSRTLPEKIYDFNELFRRRGPDSNDRTVTMPTVNPRGDGTYSAPEACIPGGQVQAESDTWSFGCVLCVVFSYLDSGARGVKEFGDRRSEMPKDQFFTMNGPNSRLSFAVERWMKELRDRAYRRSKDEGVIVNDFLAFLHNKVLVVDTKKRKETRAKDIAKYLGEIYREYAKLAKHYPNEPSPSPSNPNPRSHRRTFSLPFSRRRSAPAQTQMGPPNPSTWKIPLPDSMKASFCEFGPNGDILVYVSGSTLVAYSPRVVLDTGDVDHLIEFGREHLTPKGYGWSTVAASSQYIVAASNQPLFDCHVFEIKDSTSHRSTLKKRGRILLDLLPIWKMALSHDGEFFACVLQNPNVENVPGQLYIVPLDELLSSGSNRPEVLPRRLSVTSSLSVSTAATTLPWTRGYSKITLPTAAKDVREFCFSELDVLYAVLQPEPSANVLEHKVTVLSWSIGKTERRAHNPIFITHDGRHDASAGLFTSFAPHRQEKACTVLLQEKEVITQSLQMPQSVQNRVKGYKLQKILMNREDDRIICFGTREANNELWLLGILLPTPRRPIMVEEIAKLPGIIPKSEFSVAIHQSDPTSDLYVLVASLDGRIYQVKIPEHSGD